MEFVEFFQTLESYGLTDALLPFLLIFLIFFAVLQKTNILGAGKKNFNVMFAAIVSLITIIPHVTGNYPVGYDPVEIINTSLPSISVVVIAVIMVLILIGLLGGEAKWIGGSLSGWIAILAFATVLYIFGSSAGWWNNWFVDSGWLDSDTTSLLIILLVFAIIVWYITKDDTTKEHGIGWFTKMGEGLGNMFKK